VGLVQFRASKGDVAGSLRKLAALADRAARDADLVVLPEMAPTGYVFPDRAAVAAVAEEPDGPTFLALAEVARRRKVWLVAGFPERAQDKLFNSALVIDPQGERAFVYRKTLLYDADKPWAEPGDSGYRAFDAEGGRFGVGICMDLNDDGFLAWTRGADLDVIAFPTNWVAEPEPKYHTWDYWAWRMDGQKAALAAANTWGTDGPITFTGESAVLQGLRVLGAGPLHGDGVVRAERRRSDR
jgi:N-carbamoylputrescine amidase